MSVRRGDRVLVTQFVFRNGEKDFDDYEGFVVDVTDDTITVTQAADFEGIDPSLYLTRTFDRNKVLIAPELDFTGSAS